MKRGMKTGIKIERMLKDVSLETQNIFGDKLRKIILYGSYARGDDTVESDVDIMVLADIIEEEKYYYQQSLDEIAGKASLENDLTITIILRERNLFDLRAGFVPFYRNVLADGVEVYGG